MCSAARRAARINGPGSTARRRRSHTVLRRGEAALVTLCLAAFVLAAWEGLRHAPAEEQADLRLSTNLSGPNGAKGFAAALRRLGLRVEQRRYPLFDLADATTHAEPWRVFAFLDIEIPTDRELVAVRDYVARGGRVFIAGYTGIERCFGYRVSTVRAPGGLGWGGGGGGGGVCAGRGAGGPGASGRPGGRAPGGGGGGGGRGANA